MTVYLANAIPNSWLLKSPTFKPLSKYQVLDQVCEPDPYQDYDDHTVPPRLAAGVVSLVGHPSTAAKWGYLFGEWVGATYLGSTISVQIPVNRVEINPQAGDKVIAGLFVSPYRLPDGQRWSEEQILEHTHWVLVQF